MTRASNSSPNDKTLDWSKMKAFADDKMNLNENLKCVLGRIENIVAKGEKAGYQHFSPFLTMFSKAFSLSVVKSWDCEVKGKLFNPLPHNPNV